MKKLVVVFFLSVVVLFFANTQEAEAAEVEERAEQYIIPKVATLDKADVAEGESDPATTSVQVMVGEDDFLSHWSVPYFDKFMTVSKVGERSDTPSPKDFITCGEFVEQLGKLNVKVTTPEDITSEEVLTKRDVLTILGTSEEQMEIQYFYGLDVVSEKIHFFYLQGILAGDICGTYVPDDKITYAEAYLILFALSHNNPSAVSEESEYLGASEQDNF